MTMSDSVIAGRHAVKEALKSGTDINKVMIQDSINKGQIREILDAAKKRKIVVQAVPKNKIDGLTEEPHQGVVALASPHEYMPFETLLGNIEGRRANLVILDGLEDPHNLGSILRTCDATGFDGVIGRASCRERV